MLRKFYILFFILSFVSACSVDSVDTKLEADETLEVSNSAENLEEDKTAAEEVLEEDIADTDEALEEGKTNIEDSNVSDEEIVEPVNVVDSVDVSGVIDSLEESYSPEGGLRLSLETAYNDNPRLKAQRNIFQATVEQVPQALSGALPQISASFSKGRQRVQSAGSSWAHSDAETKAITFTQPIFRGGSTYANTKSARRNVDAAAASLIQIEQDVLFNAISSYMEVVRLNSVLELSKKNRDVLSKQLKAANQRFAVGEDTRTDVSQSRARLAVAESNVTNSLGLLEAAKAVYQENVGELPDDFSMPKDAPEVASTSQELVEMSLKTSPILLEAKNIKESADYVVDSNVGTLLPSVDLQGTVSRQEGSGIFGNTDFDQDRVVLSVNVPIFAGGQRYSRVRQAKENYQQRRFEFLDAENRVRRQASSAWEEWNAAVADIESNEVAVNAAKTALRGVRQEQQYGSRTTLDVLDAERELFDAEVRLVAAKVSKIVAAYSMLAATGKLTAENMGLDVTLYNTNGFYDDTEYKFIGF